MAIVIREYVDGGFYHKVINENSDNKSTEITEANSQISNNIDPDSIMVDIEGIHSAPYITRNFTRYMPKCLKGSVPSWTKPYRKPLIKHHNDINGEIIGRICDVKYKESDTLTGTPALEFTVNVPGKAKEDVKNGLLETASIGATIHDMRCSICGQQLANGEECEHKRGVKYGDKICTWDMYEMTGKELSYVIVPSDIYSKNIRTYPATKSRANSRITESADNNITNKGEIEESMAENKNTDAEKISSLESEIVQLKKDKEAAESSIAALTTSNTELESKVAALEDEKAQLEAQCQESENLKTTLETELADVKKSARENLIQTVQFMRKVAGKSELSQEIIESRSSESLKDSIADMKEDFNFNANVGGTNVKESHDDNKKTDGKNTPEPNSIKDPSLNNKDISESADGENKHLDLKNELFSAIYNISNLHSY